MDRRGVIVTTHSGAAVGLGTLRVSVAVDGGAPRVDLHFETPSMRCILGIPPSRLDQLQRTWDGNSYRYSLPAGDKVWLPQHETDVRPSRPPEPVIETFPLPPQPNVPVASPLKKFGAASTR